MYDIDYDEIKTECVYSCREYSIRHFRGEIGDFEFQDSEFELCYDSENGIYLHYIGKGKDIVLPEGCTSCRYLFSECNLEELDLTKFTTEGVDDMCGMFCDCSNLVKLNLNDFDTSRVTNMKDMFAGCESLNDLDISNFCTDNLLCAESMFYGCKKLKSLDLSCFNLSKVTDLCYLCTDCAGLISLDISNLDFNKIGHVDDMIYGCESLRYINAPRYVHSDIAEGLSNLVKFGNIKFA